MSLLTLGCSTHVIDPPSGLEIRIASIEPTPDERHVDAKLELVNDEDFTVVYEGAVEGDPFAWFERRTWRGWRSFGLVCSSDLSSFELKAGERLGFTMRLPVRGMYRAVVFTEWHGFVVSRPVRNGVLVKDQTRAP